MCQESLNKAQEEMTKQKEVITAQDNIIKAKYAEVAKHREQNNDSQLKIKELEHTISKHKREAEDAAAKARPSVLPLITSLPLGLKWFRMLLDEDLSIETLQLCYLLLSSAHFHQMTQMFCFSFPSVRCFYQMFSGRP